ncbi:EAL domain-containing protein [Thioalkalivibrio paradoxus]|uniref:EAL domain-containing protein n=1 Tax=Thioalkalivibrio paradoxus ARh 1 TaxID=713585 RepID=W0DT83_9GAMM|nr:EAL domain-containing response regulator [Thioalkalivibrio paradoxus]AHF00091.1 hypothetical protein THITH_09205 [Thioalkalivibrio paradoxus ARh 1]
MQDSHGHPPHRRNRPPGRDEPGSRFQSVLPLQLDELIEHWHLTRSRSCPLPDLKELRGLTKVLIGNLTGSDLTRLFTLARRIDERLGFFLNSGAQPQRHEQETIGGLFSNLRSTMEQELLERRQLSQGLEPGEVRHTTYNDEARDDRLLYFLRPEPSHSEQLVPQIESRGLCVQSLRHVDQLRTALSERIPAGVLVHVPGDGTPAGPIAAIQTLRHSAHPDTPWAWLLDCDDPRARLEAVRGGADACFSRQMPAPDVVDRLVDLIHGHRPEPYKVLVIDPDPAEAITLFSTVCDDAPLEFRCTADPFQALEFAAIERPEAIVSAMRFPGMDGIELSRLLQQADPSLRPPILLRGDSRAIALDHDRIHAEGLELLVDGESPEWVLRRVCDQARRYRRDAARLQSISKIDHPTGWYSRHYFEALLGQWLLAEDSGSEIPALLFADLDAAFEQPAGAGRGAVPHPAALPRELVKRLWKILGPEDIVGRYSATGLAILARRSDAGQIEILAAAVRQALACPTPGDLDESPAVTAGVGVVPLQGSNAQALINDAIELASRARNQNGTGILLASELGMPAIEPEQRTQWTRIIHGAVSDKRLFLVYQPVASLVPADSAERFEALLRMRDPSGQILLPGQFVGMAERLGLIRLIDRWVLAGAAAMLAQHQEAHPEAMVFMKVSAGSILDPGFGPWIGETLQGCPPRPGSLVLQIREADARTYHEAVRLLIRHLRQLHIPIVIEHFGTRADSIRLLRDLRPDFVKLDRSFTQELHAQPERVRALDHIVQQARSLGVKTIAAYVEDAGSLAILWQQHPDLIQGNFLKQPDTLLLHDIVL